MLSLRESRSCNCTEHRGDEAWHGKTTGYYRHRCDCEKCVERMRAYSRDRYHGWNSESHRKGARRWREENQERVLAAKAGYRKANRAAIYLREQRRNEAVRELDALAGRTYQRWTRAEDETVLRTDLRVVDIAAELGRTFRSVKARRAMLRRKAATGVTSW